MKVELIEHTPNPDRVCDISAHNCVSSDIPCGESKDFKSLRIALESGHMSVAEHASFTFAIEGISRACSHQLVRHRVGASFCQQSQRYVNMDNFDYVIPDSIRNANRTLTDDGDGNAIVLIPQFSYCDTIVLIKKAYADLVKAGIPEEDARYILPNACKTNIVVTMNGRELLHFINLRCCNKAQWEIREVATEMYKLVKPIAPVLFENAGPNCINGTGCKELRPCKEPVEFGAHTMKVNQ